MQKVIFDCDNTMGAPFKEVDDGLTLLYLLGQPDIELVGVTTTFGNGTSEQAYRQTKKLLHQVGRPDIPVYKGAGQRDAFPTEAAHFLAVMADRFPGEISLLATGPLSNLRGAKELDDGFFRNLKQVACMGGFLEPLTVGRRNISELNLSADPAASFTVFEAECPVALMNAQICLGARFGAEEIKHLSAWPNSIRLGLRLWLFAFGKACGVPEFYLWDLLPAVFLSHPGLFSQDRVRISSTVEDLETGTLIVAGYHAGSNFIMPSKILDQQGLMEILFQSWQKVSFK